MSHLTRMETVTTASSRTVGLLAHRIAAALDRGVRALGVNALWVTIGTVFNQGSTLISNVWIANLVGKSSFGEFIIVLSTVQATASFASLGLGYTATRYMAELRHKDLNRAASLLNLLGRLSWGAALAAALVLALASTGIASRVLLAPALGSSLLLAAASSVFTIRNGYLVGALTGLEAFRSVGIAGLISGAVYTVATIGGAFVGGVTGAVIGLWVSSLVQYLVLTMFLREAKRRLGFGSQVASIKSERPIIVRFAFPAALSALSTVPALWLVQALLARAPQGFGELAVYGAGLNLLTMVLFLPVVLNGVAMSWINRTHATQGDAAYRSALRTNLGMTLATVTLGLVGVAVLGPTLLGLYGRDFRSGYATLAVLLAAALPEALASAMNQSLQARERMWEALLGINLPRDLVIAGAAVLLVPRYGALGAAGAYLAGRLVAFGVMFYLVRHEIVGAGAAA